MRFRIKYQILLIAMIPVFLIDVFFTYVHINGSIKQAEQLLKSKGEIIAQQIAGASEYSLLSGNFDQIQHLLEQSINTNDIIFLAVYDIEGSIIAQVKNTTYNSALSTEYSYYRQAIQTQNLEYEDIFQPDLTNESAPLRHLGWIHMYISKHQLQLNKKLIFNDGAIFFCTMLLIATLLTLTISRRITRPIYALLNHLKQVETGQLGEIIDYLESNEIGDVQKGFNSMSQALLANRMQLDQKIKTATLELMNAITNLEYNNRELAIARDDAQKADQVKTQFLANMSHEIRTPINGIKGFINLLSKTGLNQDQLRYTNIITQSTIDLSSIVNEILDFSKVESGKIELLESPFDLYDLVENTRDSFFANTLEKNIDLFLTIYSDTPRLLIGDKLRLKQILINLIGNAIKFTDQGYVAITVMMEDESDQQIMVKFNIEDSGIGISEYNQKNLFKAFKQIESDSNRRFSGTGLGLVISKNLSNLMGGDIKLASESDSGTLFSLLIPFKPVVIQNPGQDVFVQDADLFKQKTVMILAFKQRALNEIQSLFNRINYNTEVLLIDRNITAEDLKSQIQQNLNYIDKIIIDLRHSFIHPDQFISRQIRNHCEVIVMHYDLSMINSSYSTEFRFISVINSSNNLLKLLLTKSSPVKSISDPQRDTHEHPKNILIVDDNSINLALACELTRLWGHNPEQASNAKQAMKLFKVKSFDLILLDIQMPEVDGVDLMLMMRKEKPDLDIPIVAITANVLNMERERLIGLGFDAYISKPIDENKLKILLLQQSPLEPIERQNTSSNEIDDSIDFDLTFNLSANNEKLVAATLSMFHLEIPEYQLDLTSALETSEKDKISSIMHKLQGVTCYLGLPRLKNLLAEYDKEKIVDMDGIVEVTRKIMAELNHIDKTIEQYNQSPDKRISD